MLSSIKEFTATYFFLGNANEFFLGGEGERSCADGFSEASYSNHKSNLE